MGDKDVNSLYENALAEARGDDESSDERRNHTRVRANATTLTVRAELQVAAIDVSASGLAFFSDFPIQVGQPIHITAGSLFTVEAQVVGCILEKADEEFHDTQYKIQCKFYEEEQGKYLLVMIKEMDKQRK